MEPNELPKGCIVTSALFGTAIGLSVSYFLCHINPAIEAGWLRGLWHGSNLIGNCILSLFDDRLLQAPLHTAAYTVFWWIFAIFAVLSTLWSTMTLYRIFKVDS
ncbi:MAG: hypothetical protein LBF62_13065 [Tannerellaceae bacterium]|jgi:hypothetical protein|nr:hypothetical protein [Tannerellaceae bacterium]